MSETGSRDLDDTDETSLADELLTASPADELSAGVPDAGTSIEEEDYLASTRRSRVTTGLVVALIFAVGVFCGVLLARALIPSPPPQIVYVLDGAGPPSPTPTPMSTPR